MCAFLLIILDILTVCGIICILHMVWLQILNNHCPFVGNTIEGSRNSIEKVEFLYGWTSALVLIGPISFFCLKYLVYYQIVIHCSHHSSHSTALLTQKLSCLQWSSWNKFKRRNNEFLSFMQENRKVLFRTFLC